MPRFHHANLGVPPGLDEAEGAFLVHVLGYRKMEVPPDLEGRARRLLQLPRLVAV